MGAKNITRIYYFLEESWGIFQLEFGWLSGVLLTVLECLNGCSDCFLAARGELMVAGKLSLVLLRFFWNPRRPRRIPFFCILPASAFAYASSITMIDIRVRILEEPSKCDGERRRSRK